MQTAAAHDSSLSKLLTLNDSWNQVAGEEAQATPTVLQKLFLVATESELQFAQKPRRTLGNSLVKAVKGEPKDASFAAHMQKIILLYGNLPHPLTESQKASLFAFEEKINALGRYVFSKRVDKTLICFRLPRLSDYQVRNSIPHELITPAAIKRGLRNPSSQLCWLNASIKFLAATLSYDPLFETRHNDPQLDLSRKALFRLIEALRRNWTQNVVDALQRELIEALEKGPLSVFLNAQQDPDEFLLQLSCYLLNPEKPREEIQLIHCYKSLKDGVYKSGCIRSTPRLQIHPEEAETIDLERSFMIQDEAEDVKDYLIREGDTLKQSDSTSDTLSFVVQDAYRHLPDLLEMTIRRGTFFNTKENNGQVNRKKIKMEPGGRLVFTEHEPLYEKVADQTLLMSIAPKFRCTYLIIASIEQQGDRSNRGHYVAHTRDPQGSVTSHNDSSISHNRPEEVWGSSYHLMLKLIERKEINTI